MVKNDPKQSYKIDQHHSLIKIDPDLNLIKIDPDHFDSDLSAPQKNKPKKFSF